MILRMHSPLKWALLLSVAVDSAAATGNQILLRSLTPSDGTPQVLAADGSGHLFVVSSLAGQGATRVVKLDLNGTRLAFFDVTLLSYPSAVADDQGNLVLSGNLDFGSTGLILKLDSQLQRVLFSKSLPAQVTAVAVGPSGNIYVTGNTASAAFPVTAGAYQTELPHPAVYGPPRTYAFLTEISPSGDQLLYSTFFGGDATSCEGGSSCIGVNSGTAGVAVEVDQSGAAVIAGTTDAYNLPTTPGAFETTCNCGSRPPFYTFSGFIAKFQLSAAQQLQWSTYLNANRQSEVNPFFITLNNLALDSAGNVVLGGTAPPGLPTTTGAIQPSIISVPGVADSGAFLIKLNNLGTAEVWGTYFGKSGSVFQDLTLDAQGRVVFTGGGYVARLSGDGTTLVDYYQGPVGSSLVLTSTGGFAAIGPALWIGTSNTGPSLLNVTNSASGQYSSGVARYELITLYGIGIGPPTPLNGQIQNGAFTTALSGWQVLIDGEPAPLLYADSGQINAVVPHILPPGSPHIVVVTPAGTIDGPTPSLYDDVPGIFHNADGFAAALNQDGSINSPSNPAKSGSIVSIFLTGFFLIGPVDGQLAPLGASGNSILDTVWVGDSRSFEVLFAGIAPGLVYGIMQVNFRLPISLTSGTPNFSVQVSGVSTGSKIAVAP